MTAADTVDLLAYMKRDASATTTDTFTANGSGQIKDLSNSPCMYFAVQVVGTGAAASAWTVALRGSLDGVNFVTPILSHISGTNADKSIAFLGAVYGYSGTVTPIKYWRIQVSGLDLGATATSIVVTTYGSH